MKLVLYQSLYSLSDIVQCFYDTSVSTDYIKLWDFVSDFKQYDAMLIEKGLT